MLNLKDGVLCEIFFTNVTLKQDKVYKQHSAESIKNWCRNFYYYYYYSTLDGQAESYIPAALLF